MQKWYKLEFSPVSKTQSILDLETIIDNFFIHPQFGKDVMVLRPKELDFKKTVRLFPPRTVNLMLERGLKLCGAIECPQPKIEDVVVEIGDELDVQSFFLRELDSK